MIKQRLEQLRTLMKREGIDVYYFNTSDYHMSEYVADFFHTIAYFSNFSGSLATLLISQKQAVIFVDGRYHLQADKQCLPYGIKVMKLGTKGALDPIEYIEKNYANKVVGLDGRRTSIAFANKLLDRNIKIKNIDIYSGIIENRSPLSDSNVYELENKYTGLSRKKKLSLVSYCLGDKVHIINNLESIAYLLNMRGNDIRNTPVFYAYLVLMDGKARLFINRSRLTGRIMKSLEADDVAVDEYDAYYDFLSHIKNRRITLDDNRVNYASFLKIEKNNRISFARSIVEDMKAIKNNVEQKNAQQAHIYDGVVMVRFLKWLDEVDKKTITEYDAARKIDELRTDYKAIDQSFNSIIAYKENGAVLHYSPDPKKSKRLDNEGMLLFDTGGQYFEGTTDVTRTIALGEVTPEMKMHYTTVLKSLFNLSEVTFLKGLSGNQLDIMARKDIWALGIDYRCGTGHGVGHMLSVHEFPPNIRYGKTDNDSEKIEIKPGMIFSDEPGIYLDNRYGIRLENMLICQKYCENEYGTFLKFDTLTLVPFDLKLIDKDYLDEATIKALNSYHERVRTTLAPYLNDDEVRFLKEKTEKI